MENSTINKAKRKTTGRRKIFITYDRLIIVNTCNTYSVPGVFPKHITCANSFNLSRN